MSYFERLPATRSQVTNRILLSLPEREFQSILPHLTLVGLRLGQVLYDGDNWIDYAYFMNSGMASLVAVDANGETIEDGIVGNDSIMGIQAAMEEGTIFYSGVVQVPGNAMRISSDSLRYQFQHNAELSRLLLRFMIDLRLQVSQSADCSRFHSLEQRLCHALLIIQDCVNSDTFTVTPKLLSHMVRASRTPVALTIELLQEAGLISCQKSYTRITDREGIMARTCECYRILTKRCKRFEALPETNDGRVQNLAVSKSSPPSGPARAKQKAPPPRTRSRDRQAKPLPPRSKSKAPPGWPGLRAG